MDSIRIPLTIAFCLSLHGFLSLAQVKIFRHFHHLISISTTGLQAPGHPYTHRTHTRAAPGSERCTWPDPSWIAAPAPAQPSRYPPLAIAPIFHTRITAKPQTLPNSICFSKGCLARARLGTPVFISASTSVPIQLPRVALLDLGPWIGDRSSGIKLFGTIPAYPHGNLQHSIQQFLLPNIDLSSNHPNTSTAQTRERPSCEEAMRCVIIPTFCPYLDILPKLHQSTQYLVAKSHLSPSSVLRCLPRRVVLRRRCFPSQIAEILSCNYSVLAGSVPLTRFARNYADSRSLRDQDGPGDGAKPTFDAPE